MFISIYYLSTVENHHHYNPKLKDKARTLRNNATKAEACLWKYVLRGKQLKGYGFRRQRPVGKYIADFMCKTLNLIIEVDGITHSYENVVVNDEVRERDLVQLGFKVIRFEDAEVLNDINRVRDRILEVIGELEYSTPKPASGG